MGKTSVLHVVRDDIEPGTIIGYGKHGPIYAIAGAAGTDIDIGDWIPIEMASEVIHRVQQASAIEAEAMPTPMTTSTKDVPRSGGVKVAASKNYTDADDLGEDDKVTLHARRFISRVTIDEDDLADSFPDVAAAKGLEWATSYAKVFDHACLGTSNAENGTTVPFTSLYKSLRTTNSATDYTADDNYVAWNQSTAPSAGYDELSEGLGRLEVGDYFELENTRVIAHPAFRKVLRGIKDLNGEPIFLSGQNNPQAGTPDTLFNIPIRWTHGARVHATNSQTPAGNRLLFFCNRTFLQLGRRSGPETLSAPSRPQDDTDDYSIKFRARRGFVLGHEDAASVVELTG
jgi:HK97 family phage major capsid protein